MDHVGEFASGLCIRDNRDENPISPNWWRMQSPGWTYIIVLYASSGRRVTGSPGAGCQPGLDLGLRPADGADSDFQRLRERPVAHFSVNCAASESGAGLYLAKAQEAIGNGGRHEHTPGSIT